MRTWSSLLVLVVAGCATDSPPPIRKGVPEQPAGEGRAIKVTYYRFQKSPKGLPQSTDKKSEELHPEYYVMLSRGWKQKRGNYAGEPFEKSVPHPFKGLDISDNVLQQLAEELDAKGWQELPDCDLTKLGPIQLLNMERTAKSNPTEAAVMRYVTVETPTSKKTVCRRDVLLGGEEISRKFAECELLVMRMAMQYTIQVSVGGSTLVPK